MGRKSIYTEEIAEEICQRLAGGESLRSICRDEHMPDKATVLRWVVKPGHPFTPLYMEAREAGGYADADDISELVQEVRAGLVDDKAARVMLHGMIWLAERKAPKKHSPRQEITGPEGAPVGIQASELEGLSPEARAALRQAAEAIVREQSP